MRLPPILERSDGAHSPGPLAGPTGVEERDADDVEQEVPERPPDHVDQPDGDEREAGGREQDDDHGAPTLDRHPRMQPHP
jgi:hypothetical protein